MNSSLLNLASLEIALRAAVAQFAVAILNLFLDSHHEMETRSRAGSASLFAKVFRIHVVFISITLSIFGALTWRFAMKSPAPPAPGNLARVSDRIVLADSLPPCSGLH